MQIQVPLRPNKKGYFLKFKIQLLSTLRKLNPFYKPPVPLPKSIPLQKPSIQFIPTNNFSSRKKQTIQCLVIHSTGSLDTEKAIEWFCSEVSQASTHFLITISGEIIQLVKNGDRSWHVSPLIRYSQNQLLVNVSLSIHLVGEGQIPFTDSQNESLIKLCKYLLYTYHLSPLSVYTHSHFEPSKECPSSFDIRKFRTSLKSPLDKQVNS